jgi:hypothetical protein
MSAPEALSMGLQRASDCDSVNLQNFSAVVGSQFGATTGAAESLIASSTHRVSSLRRDAKIEKFYTKTKF